MCAIRVAILSVRCSYLIITKRNYRTQNAYVMTSAQLKCGEHQLGLLNLCIIAIRAPNVWTQRHFVPMLAWWASNVNSDWTFMLFSLLHVLVAITPVKLCQIGFKRLNKGY